MLKLQVALSVFAMVNQRGVDHLPRTTILGFQVRMLANPLAVAIAQKTDWIHNCSLDQVGRNGYVCSDLTQDANALCKLLNPILYAGTGRKVLTP